MFTGHQKVNSLIQAVIVMIILAGCDLVKVKDDTLKNNDAPQPVARVNDTYLYKTDLEGIVTAGANPQDSADRVTAYINQWIRKQLLIDEATSRIDFDEAEIQRKILDYRYSLIAYGYQEYYVGQHLNKEVSEEEIKGYYDQNADNFPLKQNIIRGKFIKVPNDAPENSANSVTHELNQNSKN